MAPSGWLLLLLLGCVSALPSSGSGPINVRDFGARGTGTHDDTAAIQQAIDEAQDPSAAGGAGAMMGRAVYFPSGTYLVNRSLTVANTEQPGGPQTHARPVRLFGDGMRETTLVAGAAMDAVLRFTSAAPTPGSPAGVNTNGHVIESLKVNGAGLANFSVAADAITRSQVRYAMFEGALVAGLKLGSGIWGQEISSKGTKFVESERGVWFAYNMYGSCTPHSNRNNELILFRGRKTIELWSPGLKLGYGWINEVFECYFAGNLVGPSSPDTL